jgi:nucleoside-diphosphate-sugar epimerase
VLLLASRRRTIQAFGGHEVEVHPWSPGVIRAFEPTHAVHLAFRTRDMLAAMSSSDYVAANVELIGSALDLVHEPSLQGIAVTSSGAAANVSRRSAVLDDPYAVLKEFEEDLVRGHADRSGKACVVCRVWSVSGPHLSKVDKFALGSLIRQALDGGPVRVEAGHPVWRSYIDAGQVVGIALCLLLEDRSTEFDSGGVTVEVGELASEAARVLGPPGCEVQRSAADGRPADVYVGDPSAVAEIARGLGVELFALPAQLQRTAAGMDVS